MEFFSNIIGLLIVLFAFFFPILIRILEKKKKKAEKGSNRIEKAKTTLPTLQKKEKKSRFSQSTFSQPISSKMSIKSSEYSRNIPPAFEPQNEVGDKIQQKQAMPYARLLHETGSLKRLVIFHAIFGKPKAFSDLDEES